MQNQQRFQPCTPLSAIIFDCDGTLSAIEGIDELAKLNGVSEEVQRLTAKAMGQSGLNPELYQERLRLVYPKEEQLMALGQHYFHHQVPDASSIIQLLQRLDKTVYLVSAGLYPAVTIFGELLNIPKKNIFAVDITFDKEGRFLDYERTSPLIHNDGKRRIVTHLKKHHPDILFIGDGLNDIATYDLVTRFVGYGGVYYRENIAEKCQYYIQTHSLTPLLPLSLTLDEVEKLTADEKRLYQKGIEAILSGKVRF